MAQIAQRNVRANHGAPERQVLARVVPGARVLRRDFISLAQGWIICLFALFVFTGCGGGSDTARTTASSADAVVAALRGQYRMLAATTASAEEAASRLMDYAESTYPTFFPLHQANANFPPFVYRFYPETGTYLGVAVTPGSLYEVNGVYVMGGRFGADPSYVGPLAGFISPTPSLPPAHATSLSGIDVSGVPGIDPSRASYRLAAGGEPVSLVADPTKRLRVLAPLVLQPTTGLFRIEQDGQVLHESSLTVVPLAVRPEASESFLREALSRVNDAIAVGAAIYPADQTLETLRVMHTALEASLKVAQAIRGGGAVAVKDDSGNDVVLGQDYLGAMDQLATYASANLDVAMRTTAVTRTSRAKRPFLPALARLIPSAYADEQISRWASIEQYVAYTNWGTTVLGTAVAIVAVAGLGPPVSLAVGIYGLAVVANVAAAVAKEWWAPSSGFPTSGDWEAARTNAVSMFFSAAQVGRRIVDAADRFAGTSDVVMTSFEKTAFRVIATAFNKSMSYLASKLVNRAFGSLCPDGLPPNVSWSTGIGYCPCTQATGGPLVCQR